MAKWDTFSNIGTIDADDDRLLISDQSQTEGNQDRNVTPASLGHATRQIAINETSHGWAVGDCIRHNGTSFVEATADTTDNATIIGVVREVVDADNVIIQQNGRIDTLSGLTGGEVYYLQDAGGLGTTAGTIEKPVLVAADATTGWLLNIGSGGGGGGGSTTEAIIVAASDETTDLVTGTGVVTFRMPYGFTVTGVRASVTTAPTGSTIEVDINESGASILSTVLSIDAGEKTSETAATAAVISDSALADDAEITIDIDQVGSSTAGAGLKVYIIGEQA